MIDLTKIIEDKIALLDKVISSNKAEREIATMDSRSDMSGFVADQFHGNYLKERRELLALSQKLSHSVKPGDGIAHINTLVTVSCSLGEINYLLVPEGLGGIKIDNTLLLSLNSPLAQLIIGHSVGYKFTFNSQTLVLTSVRPND